MKRAQIEATLLTYATRDQRSIDTSGRAVRTQIVPRALHERAAQAVRAVKRSPDGGELTAVIQELWAAARANAIDTAFLPKN